jgi:hypothetical protein
MPIYTFRNNKTKKTFDDLMSMSEKETYLSQNPHIEQVPIAVNMGDAVRLGITKPPSDFSKYVLGKMKERHPKGNIGKGRLDAIPKEM